MRNSTLMISEKNGIAINPAHQPIGDRRVEVVPGLLFIGYGAIDFLHEKDFLFGIKSHQCCVGSAAGNP